MLICRSAGVKKVQYSTHSNGVFRNQSSFLFSIKSQLLFVYFVSEKVRHVLPVLCVRCGQVSSQCVSDLLRLASLATTRYSFSLLYILAQSCIMLLFLC